MVALSFPLGRVLSIFLLGILTFSSLHQCLVHGARSRDPQSGSQHVQHGESASAAPMVTVKEPLLGRTENEPYGTGSKHGTKTGRGRISRAFHVLAAKMGWRGYAALHVALLAVGWCLLVSSSAVRDRRREEMREQDDEPPADTLQQPKLSSLPQRHILIGALITAAILSLYFVVYFLTAGADNISEETSPYEERSPALQASDVALVGDERGGPMFGLMLADRQLASAQRKYDYRGTIEEAYKLSPYLTSRREPPLTPNERDFDIDVNKVLNTLRHLLTIVVTLWYIPIIGRIFVGRLRPVHQAAAPSAGEVERVAESVRVPVGGRGDGINDEPGNSLPAVVSQNMPYASHSTGTSRSDLIQYPGAQGALVRGTDKGASDDSGVAVLRILPGGGVHALPPTEGNLRFPVDFNWSGTMGIDEAMEYPKVAIPKLGWIPRYVLESQGVGCDPKLQMAPAIWKQVLDAGWDPATRSLSNAPVPGVRRFVNDNVQRGKGASAGARWRTWKDRSGKSRDDTSKIRSSSEKP